MKGLLERSNSRTKDLRDLDLRTESTQLVENVDVWMNRALSGQIAANKDLGSLARFPSNSKFLGEDYKAADVLLFESEIELWKELRAYVSVKSQHSTSAAEEETAFQELMSRFLEHLKSLNESQSDDHAKIDKLLREEKQLENKQRRSMQALGESKIWFFVTSGAALVLLALVVALIVFAARREEQESGQFVASKGSRVYHRFPSCAFAQKIKQANRVTGAAAMRGRIPHAGCPAR